MDFIVDMNTGTMFLSGMVALMLVVAYVLLMIRSNTFAIVFILTLTFTRALFQLAGIPRMVPVLIVDFAILLLLAKVIYINIFVHRRPLKFVGLYPMLALLLVGIISYYVNDAELLPAIFLLRQMITLYLFFAALMNLDLSEGATNFITKYIILLFLIQLPAVFIKYIFAGQNEVWIGTISWQAGQLSTTMPLLAIAFLFAFAMIKMEMKYILLIMGFIFIGLVGQKRALPVFIPSLGFFIWFFYWIKTKKTGIFNFNYNHIIALTMVIVVTVLALGAYVSLSTDEMYAERFSVKRLVNYTIWYNTRNETRLNKTPFKEAPTTSSSNTVVPVSTGRFSIINRVFKDLASAGILKQVLGFGPGAAITSPHLGRENVMLNRFHLKGAMSGLVVFVLQLGLAGVVLLVYFFLKIFKIVYSFYMTTESNSLKILSLGLLGATYVLVLDFFIYSQSTLFLGVLTPAYFYLISVVIKHNFKLQAGVDQSLKNKESAQEERSVHT